MNVVRYQVSEGQVNNFTNTPELPVLSPPPHRVVKRAPTETHVVANDNSTYIKRQGSFAWGLLHKYRGCDPQWVELWEHMIPSGGGCGCKENYRLILVDYPFDYSTPDRFFISGIALHNAVNRKLGKLEVSIEDARRIWNRPAP